MKITLNISFVYTTPDLGIWQWQDRFHLHYGSEYSPNMWVLKNSLTFTKPSPICSRGKTEILCPENVNALSSYLKMLFKIEKVIFRF